MSTPYHIHLYIHFPFCTAEIRNGLTVSDVRESLYHHVFDKWADLADESRSGSYARSARMFVSEMCRMDALPFFTAQMVTLNVEQSIRDFADAMREAGVSDVSISSSGGGEGENWSPETLVVGSISAAKTLCYVDACPFTRIDLLKYHEHGYHHGSY